MSFAGSGIPACKETST